MYKFRSLILFVINAQTPNKPDNVDGSILSTKLRPLSKKCEQKVTNSTKNKDDEKILAGKTEQQHRYPTWFRKLVAFWLKLSDQLLKGEGSMRCFMAHTQSADLTNVLNLERRHL